jgi:hypothetical protein
MASGARATRAGSAFTVIDELEERPEQEEKEEGGRGEDDERRMQAGAQASQQYAQAGEQMHAAAPS